MQDESFCVTDWSNDQFAFLNAAVYASADSLLENDLIRSYINFLNEINLLLYVNQTWVVCYKKTHYVLIERYTSFDNIVHYDCAVINKLAIDS